MNAEPILALATTLEIPRAGVVAVAEMKGPAVFQNHQDLATSVSGSKSIEDWAGKLTKACRATRKGDFASILKLSRLFHAAKSNLAYGGWSKMWQEKRQYHLPHTLRTGDKYALIGQEFGAADRKDTSSLPACVDALFYLAQIGRDQVGDLILEEKVHEYLSAKKAQALRDRYRPDLAPKARPFKLTRWLAHFHNHMEELAMEVSHEDLAAVMPEIEKALGRLSAKTARQTSETSLSA